MDAIAGIKTSPNFKIKLYTTKGHITKLVVPNSNEEVWVDKDFYHVANDKSQQTRSLGLGPISQSSPADRGTFTRLGM